MPLSPASDGSSKIDTSTIYNFTFCSNSLYGGGGGGCDVNIIHKRERNHPYTTLYKHAGGRWKHILMCRTPWKSRTKHFSERWNHFTGGNKSPPLHPPSLDVCVSRTTTTEEGKHVSILLTWCRPSVRKNTAVSLDTEKVTQRPCL